MFQNDFCNLKLENKSEKVFEMNPTSQQELIRQTATIENDTHNFQFYLFNVSKNSRFNIKRGMTKEFWKKYCYMVKQRNIPLHIGQNPAQGNCCLSAEFDLIFRNNSDKMRCKDEGFLVKLISTFQDVIEERVICSFPNFFQNLYTVIVSISQNNVIDEKGQYHERVKLHFPFCVLNLKHQKYLREEILMRISTDRIMALLGDLPEFTSQCMIGMSEDYIPLLFGSKRSINDPDLIFYAATTRLYLGDRLISYNLKNFFDIYTQIAPGSNVELDEEDIANASENHFDYLPVFLSCNYSNIFSKIEDDIIESSPLDDSESRFGEESSAEELCLTFLKLLKSYHFEYDYYWLMIGAALKNSFYDKNVAKSHWLGHTKKWNAFSKKRTEEYIEDCWQDFSISPYTWKTLAQMVKYDDKEKFSEWQMKRSSYFLDNIVANGVEKNHDDVAEAFYQIYFLDYVCTVQGASVKWYKFHLNGLCEAPKGFSIENKFTSNEDDGFITHIKNKITSLAAEEERSNSSKGKKKRGGNSDECLEFSTLKMKIKSQGTLRSYVNACERKFFCEDFGKFNNKNPYLTRCNNGVLECLEDKIHFRHGFLEDYITKSTNIDYPVEYTENHPYVKQVLAWYKSLFSDKNKIYSAEDDDDFNYCTKLFGTILNSALTIKRCEFFVGSRGNEGKSVLVKGLEEALGTYVVKIPESQLTGRKKESSGPSPEVVQASGAKLIVYDESSNNAVIDDGAFKSITGGDSRFGRNTFENGGKFIVSAKVFWISNNVPIIRSPDSACRIRLNTIRLKTIRVEKKLCPPTEEEQFQKGMFPLNPEFSSKLSRYAQAILWLMVFYYPGYYHEGLERTRNMEEANDDYWQRNDPYMSFCKERIGKAPGNIDLKIKASDVYQLFKTYYTMQYPKGMVPTYTIFRDCMTNVLNYLPVKIDGDDYWCEHFIKEDAQNGMSDMNANVVPGNAQGYNPNIAPVYNNNANPYMQNVYQQIPTNTTGIPYNPNGFGYQQIQPTISVIPTF